MSSGAIGQSPFFDAPSENGDVATVMAFVGHEAIAMSSHYTHVGKESPGSRPACLFTLWPTTPAGYARMRFG